MKKITLLAALLVGAVSFSQTVIDRAPDHTSGLISTLGDDGTGVYCADYFVLTTATELGDITIPGIASTPPLGLWVEGFNVYIFSNSSGVPGGNPELAGTAVVELAELEPADFMLDEPGGNSAIFSLNFTQANGGTPVVLPAGEYWISAFPNVIGGPADSGRWNWMGSMSGAPAFIPKLIDPSDLFGVGATAWMDIADLIGEPFPSFGWTLTGTAVVGVNDNLAEMVSIYPNPTSDILNLKVPSSVEITAVSMFDVLGKKVNVSFANNIVDTANLSAGIYMLKVETTAGSITQKIVKQ